MKYSEIYSGCWAGNDFVGEEIEEHRWGKVKIFVGQKTSELGADSYTPLPDKIGNLGDQRCNSLHYRVRVRKGEFHL